MSSSIDMYESVVYAKVNLVLSVGEQIQSDEHQVRGMHPICSWMHSINLCDQIQIQRLDLGSDSRYSVLWSRRADIDGNKIRVQHESVEWSIDDDLGVRAHKLLESTLDRTLPIELNIIKNIPAGGGLGGGSANAAGVLVGLNSLFELGMTETELMKLGSLLGSDVPYFIDLEHPIPRPAIVEGTGEQITRLERNQEGKPITLFFMSFGCSTAQVYQVFDEMEHERMKHDVDQELVRSVALSSEFDSSTLFNDLSSASISVAPDLGLIKDELTTLIGSPVHVSGSGSTLFCIDCIRDQNPSINEQSFQNSGSQIREVMYTQLC
ncbi:MAG: hypothetical protein P1U42_08165 [Phycisphaerales bacterium]|nr:hypothetical protein [Phycisphaerales bacterium]